MYLPAFPSRFGFSSSLIANLLIKFYSLDKQVIMLLQFIELTCFLSMLFKQLQFFMSGFIQSVTHNKIKKTLSNHHDPSVSSSKMWLKKPLSFECEFKDLRQTGATLTATPKNKNKKPIQPNDFEFIRFLGNGKFGSVYLARHLETGFIFAMKVINKASVQAETPQQTLKMINQLIRQIKIQMFFNHPNIIKLYSFFSDQYKIYLLLELAPDGQLYQYMKDGVKISQESVSFLMRQTILGVQHMHQHHVIHRDIKPQNIVIIHGIPKICDFGWSVYCPKEFRSTLCGTPLYLSPQILKGDHYNQKIDSWAIGTLSYELLTGQNPFKITKKSQISKIITQKFIMKQGSEITKDFLNSALEKQPQKRITSKMMLEHPFIRKYEQLETCEQICKLITLRSKSKQKNKNKQKSF